MNEQLEFLKLISERLEKVGITYMVTGSIALAVYAVPRMTRDIDLVVDVNEDDVARLLPLFENDCYIEKHMVQDAVAHRGMFNIIHNEWILKADFIVRKDEAYRKTELSRRRKVSLGDFDIWVVAPEDLLLSKLCWGGESQSELQYNDARQIVRSVTQLDWPYLEEWGTRLSVKTMLDGLKEP